MFATAREAAGNNPGDIDTITLPAQRVSVRCSLIKQMLIAAVLPEKYSFSQLHSELASDEILSKAVSLTLK
jgi:hypothetical protein